jgi:predicted nucleic acid-binding protein
MTTIDGAEAIDTNVLLCSLDEFYPEKQRIARLLLVGNPVISTQNLSELLNVLTKRWKYTKHKAMQTANTLLDSCRYVPIAQHTIQRAFELVHRYDFQLFDSLIVATALEAGCTVLYSEDMQHGLFVENQLRVLNPFLQTV